MKKLTSLKNTYIRIIDEYHFYAVINAYKSNFYDFIASDSYTLKDGLFVKFIESDDNHRLYRLNYESDISSNSKELILHNGKLILKSEFDMNTTTKNISLSLKEARKLYKETNDSAFKQLLLNNFSKEELENVDLPERWEDISVISGYYIAGNDGGILPASHVTCHKNLYIVFRTKNQAKSALAMAQLSQLMHIWNEGWEPNWSDVNQRKHCVIFSGNQLRVEIYNSWKEFLAFKDNSTAIKFKDTFGYLIMQYYNY